MMSATATQAPTADIETRTAQTMQRLLDEATSGPDKSGLTDKVVFRGIDIDLFASAGWGLRMTRTLPSGATESRHLAGDDLTMEKAAAAFAQLLLA